MTVKGPDAARSGCVLPTKRGATSLHIHDTETADEPQAPARARQSLPAGRAAVIWAWLAVAVVPLALDLVVDLTERARYAPGYHGLNPGGFDWALSFIAAIGALGLVRELVNKKL